MFLNFYYKEKREMRRNKKRMFSCSLARNTTFGYDFVKQLKRPKSKGNVRAVKLCEIHYISKDDLLEIMEIYPKFARQFQETFIQAYDLNDTEEVCLYI